MPGAKCWQCGKYATFNLPNQPARFCAEHRAEGMVDVRHKKCEHPGCNKHPYFNFPNQPARFCAEHRAEGMVNVRSKKCEKDGCNKQPIYNFPNQPARFCRLHASSGMVNVKNKNCKKCGEHQARQKYGGLCARCYAEENPSVKIPISKTEDRVLDFIKRAFPDIKFKFNKSVLGCKRSYKPDIFFEDCQKAVIVEIDEKQHKDRNNPYYAKDYNQSRDEEISKCLGKPLVIIRFNTHTYYIDGVIQYSPIHKNTQEITNQIEWNARLQTLKKYLTDAIIKTPSEYCRVHWLYYDITQNNN